MSYSMREPDWPATCECVYDEARDVMDREDCLLHHDLIDQPGTETLDRKRSVAPEVDRDEAAA